MACEAANFDPIKLLRSVHIDEHLLGNPENTISEHQLWTLAEQVAKATGKFDIGREAGRISSVEQHGALQEVFHRKTLFERLATFCEMAKLEYSRADFFVLPLWNGLVFGRRPIEGNSEQIRQVELYVLELMLETVRSVLGQFWEPEILNLQSVHHVDLEPIVRSATTKIRFSQPETQVFLSGSEIITGAQEPVSRSQKALTTMTEAVAALIHTYLFDSRMTLSFVARLLDTSERKLQRDLQKEGSNFSQILTRERTRTAVDLLKNYDIPLGEISRSIGYSNQAHFTRAFVKMAGVSPSQFRKRHFQTMLD